MRKHRMIGREVVPLWGESRVARLGCASSKLPHGPVSPVATRHAHRTGSTPMQSHWRTAPANDSAMRDYFVKTMLQFAPYLSMRGNAENNAASIFRTVSLTKASRFENAFRGYARRLKL